PAPTAFSFDSHSIRTLDRNGEIWFVAADVCNALDYADVSMTVRKLDADEKGTSSICTPSGDQNMLIINESGLYSLILTSRKPEAKRFKKWVTAEVLPAIRNTGRYTLPSARTEKAPSKLIHEYQTKAKALEHLFGQKGRASHAIHARIRKEIGVSSVTDMGRAEYTRAIQLLDQLT